MTWRRHSKSGMRGIGKRIWEEATDLIYPRRCPVCDSVLDWHGLPVCAPCAQTIHFLEEPLCRKCGKKLEKIEAEYCYDCSHKIHWYEEGIALFEYRTVRESLWRFKYAGRQEYAQYYAMAAAERFGDKIRSWQAQALVPIPIHRKREQKRGYNQAGLFAKELSKRLAIPLLDNFMIRCKNTAPQKNLDDRERQNNLKRAFKIYENDVKLDTLIIIDDIYTTGSTIDAAASVCKASGVKRVYFVALAIGEGL